MRDAGDPIQMSGAPVLTEVCIGEETLRWADGPHGRLPVCGKVLDPAAYRAIRDETDRWAIREEISEWYDYDFYANLGGEQLHQMEFALNDETILVKDDTFYGIVLPYPDGSLRYACAGDWQGKPLCVYIYEEPKDPFDLINPLVTKTYQLVRRGSGEKDETAKAER